MKQIAFFVLLILFSLGNSCSAQTARSSVKSYLIGGKITDSIPAPLGLVSDYEKIFSDSEVIALTTLAKEFNSQTGYVLAILTVDHSLTSDSLFEDYILKVANGWGVGEKGLNNGMVIGISKDLRHMRIANGTGVVTRLSDAETKAIINQYFIPNFKKGNYYEGTRQGILALLEKLK